jgi:hypothetical protein
VRAPRDAEILVAIVAGQVFAADVSNDYPEFSFSDVVDKAEGIVAEVLRRGDARADV